MTRFDHYRWLVPLSSIAITFLTLAPLAVPSDAIAQADDTRAAQQADADAESDWRFIERLRADAMEDVAARQLVLFAERHPSDPRAAEALLEAAGIYGRIPNVDAALGAYDELLKRYPTSVAAPRGLIAKGELLVANERHAEAVNVFRGMLASYPADDRVDEARLGLGESLLALSREEEAARLFRYLIGGRAEPRIAARSMFDLGVIQSRAGDDSLAVQSFETIAIRHPNEPIGAFGLLRAAEILQARGDVEAARLRLEALLANYDTPFLIARAHLSLAGLAASRGDWRVAAGHYERVAKDGGQRAQVEAALLGLANAHLERGAAEDARAAAEAYLELYSDGGGVDRARLLLARAQLRDEDEAGLASLRQLGAQASLEIRHEAWSILAMWHAERGEVLASLDAWREAARTAGQPDARAEAVLAQAQLSGDELGRHALAAELAEEAASRAVSAEMIVSALSHAMQQHRYAGDLTAAQRVAQTIATDFPVSAEAAVAQLELRRLERTLTHDKDQAALELAALALREDLSSSARALAAGRILRDQLGDLAAASEYFERAESSSETPVVAALAGFELGRTREEAALDLGLDGEDDQARRAITSARAAYAGAAAQAGGGEGASAGFFGLMRLELSMAALPNRPWLFDARRSPLLGGVGDVESVNIAAPSFDNVRRRLAAALEEGRTGDRGWLLWRSAELATQMEPSDRFALLAQATSASEEDDLKLAIRFTRAFVSRDAGDDAAAASDFRAVVAAAQGQGLGLAARYALAEAHRSAKRYAPAGQLYAEVAGALPSTQRGQRSLLLAGDCALYSGEGVVAVQRYEALLERYPNSVYRDDAKYRLGSAELRRGRLESARAHLRELIDWAGGSDYEGRAYAKLAELERQAGELEAASAAYEGWLAADARSAAEGDAAASLAEIALLSADSARAISWLNRREARGDSRGLRLRIEAEAKSGDFNDAREHLQELSLGFPGESAAVVGASLELAEALDAAKRSSDALALFEEVEAEAQGEDWARLRYGIGVAQIRLGQFDDARAAFESVVSRHAEGEWGAQSYFKLGTLHSRNKDESASQEAFAKFLRLHPHHDLATEALRAEARAWRNQGRYDEALTLYHRLLEDYPDVERGEEILGDIAYCHHEMGQHELSIAAYRRVLPLLDEEGRGYAQFWMADSLEQLGRYDEAAAEFLRIPYLYPTLGQLPVTAQLRAGGVYERAGEAAAATRIYERVLAAHGAGSTWGAEATRRLSRIQTQGSEES